MTEIKVTVQGADKLKANLDKFPRQISKYLQAAGKEAASLEIFPTEGLKKYPPLSAANQPPTPYYIRGQGTQTASGNKQESERAGTQWYVKPAEKFGTEIGNRASYGRWLYGEGQAQAMGRIGWRKLVEVVDEKMTRITERYQAWVNKLIKDLGL